MNPHLHSHQQLMHQQSYSNNNDLSPNSTIQQQQHHHAHFQHNHLQQQQQHHHLQQQQSNNNNHHMSSPPPPPPNSTTPPTATTTTTTNTPTNNSTGSSPHVEYLNDSMAGWIVQWFNEEKRIRWKLGIPQFKYCKKRKDHFSDEFSDIWYKAPYKYHMSLDVKNMTENQNVMACIDLNYEDGQKVVLYNNATPGGGNSANGSGGASSNSSSGGSNQNQPYHHYQQNNSSSGGGGGGMMNNKRGGKDKNSVITNNENSFMCSSVAHHTLDDMNSGNTTPPSSSSSSSSGTNNAPSASSSPDGTTSPGGVGTNGSTNGNVSPQDSLLSTVTIGPFSFNICSYKQDGRKFRMVIYLYEPSNGSTSLTDTSNGSANLCCCLISPAFTIRAKKPIAKPGSKKKEALKKRKSVEDDSDSDTPQSAKKMKEEEMQQQQQQSVAQSSSFQQQQHSSSMMLQQQTPSGYPAASSGSSLLHSRASLDLDTASDIPAEVIDELLGCLNDTDFSKFSEKQMEKNPERISTIASSFQKMNDQDRKSLLCRLIESCLPHEREFIYQKYFGTSAMDNYRNGQQMSQQQQQQQQQQQMQQHQQMQRQLYAAPTDQFSQSVGSSSNSIPYPQTNNNNIPNYSQSITTQQLQLIQQHQQDLYDYFAMLNGNNRPTMLMPQQSMNNPTMQPPPNQMNQQPMMNQGMQMHNAPPMNSPMAQTTNYSQQPAVVSQSQEVDSMFRAIL